MSEEPISFGQEVYEALEEHSRTDVLTRELKYAQIQTFKKASREQIAELFKKDWPRLAREALTAPPVYFAAYFTGFMDSGALTDFEKIALYLM